MKKGGFRSPSFEFRPINYLGTDFASFPRTTTYYSTYDPVAQIIGHVMATNFGVDR